jgi:hypothetical protein
VALGEIPGLFLFGGDFVNDKRTIHITIDRDVYARYKYILAMKGESMKDNLTKLIKKEIDFKPEINQKNTK